VWLNLENPSIIPVGLTIAKGNVNDQTHFQTTFEQVKDRLKIGSIFIFDKGANGKENLKSIIAAKMQFITAKKLNTSDDKLIKKFWKMKQELVDSENASMGLKFLFQKEQTIFSSQKNYKKKTSLLLCEKQNGS